MAEQAGKGRTGGDGPRTDLPPKKEPYYEGYFGADEEERIERTREDPAGGGADGEPPEGEGESARPQ